MLVAWGKRRSMALASAALALAMGVAACGGGGSSSTTVAATTTAKAKTIRVAAALIGPKNDRSFNQAAYEGIQEALKKYPNMKLTSTLENLGSDAQRTDALQTLAPNNDVVVAVSAAFGPVLDLQAPKFPNTTFLDIAGNSLKFHKNVTGFVNDYGATAYVAGVLAAHMTKTNVVGYVGGAEIPPTTQGAAGFAAGVKAANPKVKVLTNIVGDFNDVAKAKAATGAMLSDRADVILPFLDAGIAGTFAAGKQSGKDPAIFKLILPDCTSYDNIVGTLTANNALATSKMLGEVVSGTLKPGAIFVDLQSPDVQTVQLCPKYKSNKAIAALTKKTIGEVNSGAVKLPKDAVNPRPPYQHSEGF